jgi:hypothetical protein
VKKHFEIYRHLGNKFVNGWLVPEMLEILAAVDSAQRAKNVSGAVAEIGVHHGRFFIGLNLLRRQDERSVAIDIFGDQELNLDKSGKGDLAVFRRNVQRWSSSDGVAIHQGDSTALTAEQLLELAHEDIRLFSVDGGHTDAIVFSDMNLAGATVATGGVVFADDVYNQEWPGVMSGTLRYLNHGGQLVPFAIGFNKVLFSYPEFAEYYRGFLESHFGDRVLISTKTANFGTHEVLIIVRTLRRPRDLMSKSPIARRIYLRMQEWRNR